MSKGVGKIYRKRDRSECNGVGTFFNTVNHGAETFFDKKITGRIPFFHLKITGQILFFSEWETHGAKTFLKQDDGGYTFLSSKIYTGHVISLTDIPSFLKT